MNSVLDAVLEIAFGQSAEPRRDLVDGAVAARDVGDEIDDFHDAVVEIENRIVGRLDPDFLAALADALEFLADMFAAIQFAPEFLIFGGLRVGRVDEYAMMLALDFLAADSRPS